MLRRENPVVMLLSLTIVLVIAEFSGSQLKSLWGVQDRAAPEVIPEEISLVTGLS